jgi:GNAT superfamily N-acetyltransferase
VSDGTIELLSSSHDPSRFESGEPELDDWIKRFALASQQAGGARVYVLVEGAAVLGYYALAAASVDLAEAPSRVSKGLARHPIPVILLARLAVDRSRQGKGLGSALLKDALLRAVSASSEIGARAVLVHAKDEEARAFYEHFDFEPSPTDPFHLFLLMKDIRALLRGR